MPFFLDPIPRLGRAAVIGLGLALVGQAGAVRLDPHGVGQVLLYPYYTVNVAQQTYVSLTNTTNRAKALQVDFREGHNSRSVLSLRVYLAPYDTWTGTVFALADAVAGAGDGAALLSSDGSCTSPSFSTQAHGTVNGQPYLRFSTTAYAGDPGPQDATRTREGHVEVVALADLTGSLAAAITQGPGGTSACAVVADLEAPTAETLTPDGGLIGSGAVINVGQGTYFPYRATALDGFTSRVLVAPHVAAFDPLGEAGDAAGATATVGVGATTVQAAYPADRRIDAVSAALTANEIHNDYLHDAAIGANSDWLMTFPTKRFYTAPGAPAIAPFAEPFGADGSCVMPRLVTFTREGVLVSGGPFGAPSTTPNLCYATNVLPFVDGPPFPAHTDVLGSRLRARMNGTRAVSGLAQLGFGNGIFSYALRPSLGAEAGVPGHVFHGLPVIGFWASNLVNGHVADGVLANYSGVVPHAVRVACTIGEVSCG